MPCIEWSPVATNLSRRSQRGKRTKVNPTLCQFSSDAAYLPTLASPFFCPADESRWNVADGVGVDKDIG